MMNGLLEDPCFAPLDLTAPIPEFASYHAESTPSSAVEHIELARSAWRESTTLVGTVGEIYLRDARGIALDLWPRCIKFHPTCYHGPTKTRHPALITLMTDVVTNEPRAIHRTFLKQDGSGKADIEPNKMMLGPAAGTVARLSDDHEVTLGLGLTEGLETGLSILSIGWRPIWAALSTANMINFPVLEPIQSLTLFADNDEPGIAAAEKCAGHWIGANPSKEIFIRKPHHGGDDWNDAVRKKPAAP